MLVFTTFLGAFLLFVVEPLVAKMLLPRFGGAASVWMAALLFFQVALLVGYAYADWSTRRLKPRAQALIHLALLALGCATLPLAAKSALPFVPPALQVLCALIALVGLPYLVLAATGPLVQGLWARTRAESPYRLYAVSNLGSLLGLLAYPTLLEPRLGLRAQSWLWSGAFAIFAVLCGGGAWTASRGAAAIDSGPEAAEQPEPSLRDRAFWVLLPLCSAALLSSVTGDLTLNVAPVPLLWVLPLAVYLLSFILCFSESERFRRRAFLLPGCIAALAFLAFQFRAPFRGTRLALEVSANLAALFFCSMALHGELVRLRPHGRSLTRFYLHLAAGGALGGGFVALGAPLLFRTDLDLGVATVATALTLAFSLWRERPVLRGVSLRRALRLFLLLGVTFVAARLFQRERAVRQTAIFLARDFYGTIRVQEEPLKSGARIRTLAHGNTQHGSQFLAPGRLLEPTSYYSHHSGIGLLLDALRLRTPALRVGVIGLGAGVLASYCRPGDRYRFYELDPLIEQIARRDFTFLRSCAGSDVVLGDARLTLAAGPPQQLDLLVVDAFSSDAIPVHLLTAEAFALFAAQLGPDGLLAFHVSNRFLDLDPIVAASAAAVGRTAVVIDDDGALNDGFDPSEWILIPASAGQLRTLAVTSPRMEQVQLAPGTRGWTDDSSNVWSALHRDGL